MAPFVVKGEALTIAIHARSKSDRRYAERFAEDVVAVAYDTLERSPGRGLVIVGQLGEPHPLLVFRRFLELQRAGELSPAWAQEADDLVVRMQEWERVMQGAKHDNGSSPIDFDVLLEAVPVPLEGIGAKLYRVAWAEQFTPARVDDKLRTLTAADLASNDLADYDWVLYLPPRQAFDRVLKQVLPAVMKQEKMGLMQRAALRSALVVFRPAVKKAIEGARKGMLLMTIFRARSGYSKPEINALTGAYVKVLMPDFKFNGATEHTRAVEAIEAQKLANEAYARDPFVAPARLTEFAPEEFTWLVGDFADEKATSHRFRYDGSAFTWRYQEKPAMVFYPAGERLLVNEKGTMTIHFLVDDAGVVTGVEERWERRRKTVPKQAERQNR